MASKSHQTKKQQILRDLEAKRLLIQKGSERLQANFNELPYSTGKADAQPEVGNRFPTLSEVSHSPEQVSQEKLTLVKEGLGKMKSLGMGRITGSKRVKEVQAKMTGADGSLPVKPILIGLGGLLVLGIIVGKRKKKKRLVNKKVLAEAKEQNQVAKYGAGVLFFKWLLGASQPAMKYYVTKRVKNSLLP